MSSGPVESAGWLAKGSPRPGPRTRILLVDDDLLQARLLKAHLDRHGSVEAETVHSAEDALQRLARTPYEAVVTDLLLSGTDGIELVRRIRETDPFLPVVIITAYGTLERAVEAMRAGATDVLPKPVNAEALLALVERGVAERPLREEMSELLQRRAEGTAAAFLVGEHPLLETVRTFARHIARVPTARVLITGETGTGKSFLARAIHDLSGAAGRFVQVNCAGLPAHLLESELFGHEKGAFTDAKALKRGLAELADGGTLLLDEIGATPLDLQAKLLQFLETQEVRRVGGTDPVRVRTRVVAATNEDLGRRVRDHSFRADLFYRLDVASVRMPALREMPSAIAQLAEHFVRTLTSEARRSLPRLTPGSFALLREYDWPGNARELRNAVERALIFYEAGPFQVLPPVAVPAVSTRGSEVVLEPGLTLEEVERRYLAAQLERTPDADLSTIARRLGISRKTLWERRRRYGL